MSRTNRDASPDPQRVIDSYFHEQAPYWQEIYKGTGVMDLVHQLRLRVVLDFASKLAPSRARRVLDAGCGAGLTTVELARRGYCVYAVDSVPDMIELTRAAADREEVQSRVRLARGNVQDLPFADACFDLVIASGVLPWVPDPEDAVRELSRVLKPGGRIILTTDNRWGLCWVLDPLTNPWLKPLKDALMNLMPRILKVKPRARVRMTSITECARLLRANNLSVYEQSTLGFGPFSFFKREVLPQGAGVRVHGRLQTLADREYPVLRWAGAQYVVMAEKSPARLTTDAADQGAASTA